MSSILNYNDQVKDRPSNVIFTSVNRLYDAKLSGALKSTELSEIIIGLGDLFANKIKQGKVTLDEIESAESFLTQFATDNKDVYFSYKHEDLSRAAKTFLEGDDFALEKAEERNMSSKNVFEFENYGKSLIKH